MTTKGLSFRIQTERKKQELTKSQLARKVGVTRSAVGQWENGYTSDLKAKYIFDLASALNVSAEELYFGTPTAGFARSLVGMVPLIEWNEIEDKTVKGISFIPTTQNLDADNGFALKMDSDVMQAVGSPFPLNSKVIFARDREWKSGDYVVAQCCKNGGFIFRQIMVDGNSIFLKPLNPQYPVQTCDEDLKVVGIAVETLNQI